MLKISIVVAAYNVEKYINRCIDSILNQTYKNIQIILVNDCSTDRTKDICQEYTEKDERVILVNKQINEGLSEARNSGIKEAIGDYLTFVDGDDFLDSHTIEICVKNIESTNADEVVFGSCFDKKNGRSINMDIISSKEFFTGSNDLKIYFNEAIGSLPNCKSDRNIGITPWGRVYKTKILLDNNLKFISERKYIYEDLTFFLLSSPHINSVQIITQPLYHYCENDSSLTQKYDEERFSKVKRMYEYIKETYYSEIFDQEETILRFKRQMLSYIRLSIIQLANNSKDISLIKKICLDEFTREILKDYPIRKLPLKQRVFTYLLEKRKSILLYYICHYNK